MSSPGMYEVGSLLGRPLSAVRSVYVDDRSGGAPPASYQRGKRRLEGRRRC